MRYSLVFVIGVSSGGHGISYESLSVVVAVSVS